jgi:hypothetical protein
VVLVVSQDEYEVYVHTIEEQGRRNLAISWFMGWLAGYTDSGGVIDGDEVARAQQVAEEKFGVELLGAFGPSETPREEE